jgi:hypothetical protein
MIRQGAAEARSAFVHRPDHGRPLCLTFHVPRASCFLRHRPPPPKERGDAQPRSYMPFPSGKRRARGCMKILQEPCNDISTSRDVSDANWPEAFIAGLQGASRKVARTRGVSPSPAVDQSRDVSIFFFISRCVCLRNGDWINRAAEHCTPMQRTRSLCVVECGGKGLP